MIQYKHSCKGIFKGKGGKVARIKQSKIPSFWSTALYIRLSREDDDEKTESNSITNQREQLNQFIEENPEFVLYDTYVDDGFSGTDFNRPSFQRLLQDMKDKKINSIIVKDLSRLGRNYIEVGNYIEQIFPLFNIRFVALNDSLDSFKNPNQMNNILVPFKNLINDEYARDISQKIKSSLNSKKKKGDFTGSFATYGYIRDTKNKGKIIVDDVAANVVKDIFKWYLEGLGKITIAKKLNEIRNTKSNRKKKRIRTKLCKFSNERQ
jgi:DNA invertase Pin-like site-specific DNA recombinase